MALPPELVTRCHEVLLVCSEFDNHNSLKAVFVTPELGIFENDLPECSTKNDRVSQTLAYLISQRLSDNRSALPLFLAQLQNRRHEGDALYDKLQTLVEDILSALSTSRENTGAEPRLPELQSSPPKSVVVKTRGKAWFLQSDILHELPDGPTLRELRKRFGVRYLDKKEIDKYPVGPQYPSIVPRVVQDEHRTLYLVTNETSISEGTKQEIDGRIADYLADGYKAFSTCTADLYHLKDLPPLGVDTVNTMLESAYFFVTGQGDEMYLLKAPFIRWVPSPEISRELAEHLDIGDPIEFQDAELDSKYILGPSISQRSGYGIQNLEKWKE